jgi:hypothetical protein
MMTFLFLNRSIGYALGIAIALSAIVFFGNMSAGGVVWNNFILDFLFGSILAYSIGLLIESISMFFYLRSLRMK